MFVVDSVASHAIYVGGAEGGEPRRIALGRRPVWRANSGTVIYTNDEPGKNHSLWQIPFDVTDGTVLGAAEPLTVGRGHEHMPQFRAMVASCYIRAGKSRVIFG